ncbi:STAS domain-containing protein [Streptomyces tritici]|uniref:STAS domain-containing protein n=1 Tax=Streptomyces tritici TaxID=2054410 RepID=UPI003AEFDE65
MGSDQEHTPHTETDTRTEDPYVLGLRGDMDLHHADELRALLFAGIAQAPDGAEIVIDLRNSSFCDTTGLNVLLAARDEALDRGHSVRLAAPSHQMVRLLEITGRVGLFGWESHGASLRSRAVTACA